MKLKVSLVLFILLFGLLLATLFYSYKPQSYAFSPTNWNPIVLDNPYIKTANVYKGQLHCHTKNSDGIQSPIELVTAYRNANYDFVAITDHDYVTPDTKVEGMLFITGNEVTSTLEHITTINIARTPPSLDAQEVIGWTKAQEGLVWLTHPNLYPWWMIEQMIRRNGYNGIEVYSHPSNLYAEEVWDYILSNLNRKITGIAVDDCHNLKDLNQFNGGWVMVFANSLARSEVLDNLKKGNFYATQGPIINAVEVKGTTIGIELKQTSNVTWIGVDGSILQETKSAKQDSYVVKGNEKYVRIRVESSGYAWTNPIYVPELVVDSASVSDSRVNPSQLITISGQTYFEGTKISPASGDTVQAYVDLNGENKVAMNLTDVNGLFTFPSFPAENTVGLYNYNVYTVCGDRASVQNQTMTVIVDGLKVSNYTTNLLNDKVDFQLSYAYDDKLVQNGNLSYAGLFASTNMTGWATVNLSSLKSVEWGSTAHAISEAIYGLNSSLQNQTVSYTKKKIEAIIIKSENPITNVEWNFFTRELKFESSGKVVAYVGNLGNATRIEVDGATSSHWSYDSILQQNTFHNVQGKIVLQWTQHKFELWMVAAFSMGLVTITTTIFYKRR